MSSRRETSRPGAPARSCEPPCRPGVFSASSDRVTGLSRSTYCRTRAAGGAKTLRDHGPVRQWINDFAATHRRWANKRAWVRAKSEGIVVGRDTFRHLWRTEGLRVRPRKASKPRASPRLQRLVRASAPG